MRIAVLLLAAAVAPGLCACRSGGPDRTGQSTQGFFAATQDDIWEVAEREMNKQGFAVDSENCAKSSGTMVSRWSINLHPFSHHGYRDQATIRINPVKDRPSYYTVEANVVRQINKNIKEPTNPARVDWDTGTRVPEVERILKDNVELFFLGHDVSDEFRAKWGMAPARPKIAAPGVQNTSTSDRPR